MSRWPLSLLLALSFAGAGRAQLDCDKPIVPLGDVCSGATLTHCFTLVNRGAAELVIGEVRTECCCTVPKLETRHLQPGAQTTLGLIVNTLTQAAGPQSWPVRLQYHCGDQEGELLVALTGTIIPTVSVEPAALGIYTETGVRREITLLDRRSEPFGVRVVYTTSPKLTAVQGEPRRDADGHALYTIHLTVAPDFPEGRHEETLFIYTTDVDFRELKVPVTVIKKQHRTVSATPESITLTAAKGQPIPSSLIRLRGPDDVAMEIERVEADHPAIRCTWAPEPNNMATVKIAYDRSKIDGDGLRTAVHIHIAKPTPQTLTIPISCTLR